jgi:hypothetical protein
MKTFRFFVQSEQEPGNELGAPGDGQKIELTLPDGFGLTRPDSANEEYVYTVTEGGQPFFSFTILPAVPNMGLPAAVVLREKGNDVEGTL